MSTEEEPVNVSTMLSEETPNDPRRYHRLPRLGRMAAMVSLAVLLLLSPIFTCRAAASSSGDPNINLQVEAAPNAQDTPAAIPDGSGGAIIVWEDYRNGTGWDVYAQHVLACGNTDPTWPADGVLVAAVGSTFVFGGVFPGIVTDGSGGAFVLWNGAPTGNGSPSGGFAQHLLSTGVTDPSWPVGGLMTGPFGAAGTSDDAHGAFIAWQDASIGPANRRVFVQHLLSSGVDPAWPASGVRACPGSEFDQFAPTICRDGAGGAIVSWGDRRTAALTNRDIFAQRISASGSLLWAGSGMPVCTAVGQQLMNGFISTSGLGGTGNTWSDIQSCAMVPDGANGCFVTWDDGRTLGSTSADVYAQHLTASGAAAWTLNGVLLCADAGGQFAPTILSDGAGGAFATWVDTRASVFAQHVTASGTVDGPPDGLALSTAGSSSPGTSSSPPSGVSDGSGGAIFTWADYRVAYEYPFGDEGDGFIRPAGHIYSQHVRTAPSFSVDLAWPVDGLAVSTAPGGQDMVTLNPSGGAVSDGSGGVIAYWTDYRGSNSTDAVYTTTNSNIYAQRVLASGILPVFSATGHVLASCPSSNTGLLGVTVDAYQVGSGDLVGSSVTDATGSYTIPNLNWGSSYTLTDVTPLDYASVANDLPANGCSAPVDFALQCRAATGTVQSMGFWKHEVGVATGGNGHGQLSPATLCSYLDLIAVHFNNNEINPVIVYQPPASGQCADKLQVARVLLDLQGNAAMIARARQMLMSLLLNVAAGNISQTHVISADGATVSQAITYCDNVIDSPTGNYERAKSIADDVNNGVMVPAGWIPLTTAQIAYRRGMEGVSFRAMPGAGGATRDFQFMTGARGPVSLRIFDVSGRLVAELYHGTMEAGPHSVSWNGRTSSGVGIARGLYFARLQTPRESPTIKVLELAAVN